METTGSSGNLAGFATAFLGAFGIPAPAVGEAGTAAVGLQSYGNFIAGGGNPGNSAWPKGFLNILVFDKNFALIDIAYQQLEDSYVQPVGSSTKMPHQQLSRTVTIKEPGYVYIYLSNEGNVQKDIYFDDMSISLTKSKIIQTSDYYSFGLAFNSYARENSVGQNYGYNAKEFQEELGLGWLDYIARQYDPTIGRFMIVDPAADAMRRHSPYNYAFDNPVIFTDPDGMVPEEQGKSSFGEINFNAGMSEEELQQKAKVHADMLQKMDERRESEIFLKDFFGNSSGNGKSRSERREERQERKAARKKGNRENLVEFLQFFFNKELIRLNEMANKNNWIIRWTIEEKDKYTRWYAPGDTREESGTADGKRKVLVSLHRTLFTVADPKVLYTAISHEFVHLEDFLNGNIDLWEGWYSQQEANDIAEHHAYLKSNSIAEQMGYPPPPLPELPHEFFDLKLWNDW